MRNNTHNNRNSGFSMVEMMAAVAILIILLGISSVAAAYYVDYLKITELDNAAREIYMAAENRAVLLGGSGQLEKARSSGGAQTLAEGAEALREVPSLEFPLDMGPNLCQSLDLLFLSFLSIFIPEVLLDRNNTGLEFLTVGWQPYPFT